MAEVDYAELCLPSEFLAEDIFLEEKTRKMDGDGTGAGDGDACFPSEFPYDWVCVSDDNSKAGSVAVMEGSQECSAGLSRQMENYFLQEAEKVASSALAVDDPRATWSVGSSREVSKVLSLQQKQAGRGLLCPPAGNPFSPFAEGLTKTATIGYNAQPSLSKYKDVVDQIQQLKRQQLVELQVAAAWRRHDRGAKGGGGLAGSRPARPPGSPRASWTPLPQQAGSGMRAVFLGAGTRRETCGTGVFLPRRVGSPAEPRKKPGLSTVLLPAKVMQALNLNLDDLVVQPRSSGVFVLQHDAIMDRNSALMPQGRGHRPQPVHAGHHQREVCLPAEWTY